jgi:ABC-type Fe3+-siderophore transport system permease subunit
VTPRTLRRLGAGCLLAVAGFAAVVLAVSGAAWPYAAFLVAFVAWPLLSLAAWRRRQGGLAWGAMALCGAEGAFLGFSWGGLLLYGLVPYAAGNLAFRWLHRAEPNP